ncbi:MAG: SDR family oxidoreductase [Balneolaceae bacterium]|nr:SDR family oxidoreductase [Balneolaceae bacterium]
MIKSEKSIALVTGANRGIGLEICRQLSEKQFRVVLTSRNEQKGREAVNKIQTCHSSIEFHQLDVTDPDSVSRAARFIEQEFGRLDLLINNAAIHYDTWQQAANADMATVEEALDTNLLGPWRVCRGFLPLLKESGSARIVNVSSESGSLSGMGGGTPAYGVSKAALNAVTIKLAAELRGSGILVNAVCPGWVRTEMGGSAAPRSVAQGAQSVIWAATLPDDGPTGGFFRDGKRLPW